MFAPGKALCRLLWVTGTPFGSSKATIVVSAIATQAAFHNLDIETVMLQTFAISSILLYLL
jgi:hypothetical protein